MNVANPILGENRSVFAPKIGLRFSCALGAPEGHECLVCKNLKNSSVSHGPENHFFIDSMRIVKAGHVRLDRTVLQI